MVRFVKSALAAILFAPDSVLAAEARDNRPVCTEQSCLAKDSALIQQKVPELSRATPSLTEEGRAATVNVVSYNLFHWNVDMHHRWGQLYSRLREEQPFDLIGFQECENVDVVLESQGLAHYGRFMGPKPNPAPLAWNSNAFTTEAGPGTKWIGHDRWGDRHLNWVRLKHTQTGAKVFFANTHGPLGPCDDAQGERWLSGVQENKADGDIIFLTGDFNCQEWQPAIRKVKSYVDGGIDGGIDFILTRHAQTENGGRRSGGPSDHPMIKGSFRIEGSAR